MNVTATIYAYATNFDDNTVSQYQLNQDGSLAPLSGKLSVPSNGTQPFSISVEPTGEYVYVANWTTSTVAQYKIQSDGSLTSIGTGTVQVGLFPNSVTISKNDSYAYVASLGNNTISQFRIGLDGQLIALDTPTVASGTAPAAVVVDPTDHFAYVANYGQNSAEPPPGPGTISQYSIGSDGSLTPIGSGNVASGQGPNAVTINHAGTFVYVANHGDGTAPGTVGQYLINTDGSLTSVATANVGLRPVSIAIDKTDQFLYVANRTDGTISQFSIDATTGALTPMTPATVAVGTGTDPSAVAIDPTGKALYATDRGSNKVYQFTIDPTSGALAAYATNPTVDSGLHPTAIATGY
jgi:6-phosphogluconolactonase (cycloisomerase 2 family)